MLNGGKPSRRPPEVDSVAFREFEHHGWEKLPQRYHDAFASLTSQAIEPLLDAVAAKRGTKLLDVATGPGYVAAAAAARGADAVGTDFAAAMVAEASRRYPAVKFQEGDAEELPFPGASFDAVTMNFGLLHLGRPERAIAEACRVLRSGGRFAFTVWAKPEEARGFGIVLAAIQKHGNTNAPIPAGPPFFRFSDPEECRRALSQAGFQKPHVKSVPQLWRLESPGALWEFMYGSTVRTGALLRAQTAAALDAIRAEVIALSKTHLPMPAVLASAIKP
jgi:ubiquinone/menaquinone biosynthesis C-methylase UbiE